MRLAHIGNFLQGVENTSASFAMNQHYMGDAAVLFELVCQSARRHLRRFIKRHQGASATHERGESCRPLAVSAVIHHQYMAASRHNGSNSGFNTESTTALERHHDMRVMAANDIEQTIAHAGRHGVEVSIPRTPVLEHGQLGAQRCGQRARGQ